MGITVHHDKKTVYRCDKDGCREMLELDSYYKRDAAVHRGWFFDPPQVLCPRCAPDDELLVSRIVDRGPFKTLITEKYSWEMKVWLRTDDAIAKRSVSSYPIVLEPALRTGGNAS